MKPLTTRMSTTHYELYQSHQISAKELALAYGVTVTHLYRCIKRPPKPKETPKSELIRARRTYRKALAFSATVPEVAKLTHYSITTIERDRREAKRNAQRP